MDWQKGRQSDNVVQDDGSGGGGGFGGGGGGMRFGGFHLGIGGTIIVVIIALIFPQTRPLIMNLFLSGGGVDSSQQAAAPAPGQRHAADANDPQVKFVSTILASTEDVWGPYFQSMGNQYERPKLVLFHGQTSSGCGAAQEAMGPFYCPADHQVYLDLDFFKEMDTRFHASGDFARAYVIAHEVGHHVQNLLGVMQQVGRPTEGATGTSVRLELQADCFAGVWGNKSQAQLNWLQAGDIDSALNAAAQVGDDTLQKESRGYAVPDSFTHGTSAQRSRWFKAGFQSGDIRSCDTFNAATL
ncbi:MAG: neutral zinc metallopeptidase [Xanthomonadales bacterium PRO7]|nr:neutral zinc metallopeptidase [Xanthomonadales bacterium PRO7]